MKVLICAIICFVSSAYAIDKIERKYDAFDDKLTIYYHLGTLTQTYDGKKAEYPADVIAMSIINRRDLVYTLGLSFICKSDSFVFDDGKVIVLADDARMTPIFTHDDYKITDGGNIVETVICVFNTDNSKSIALATKLFFKIDNQNYRSSQLICDRLTEFWKAVDSEETRNWQKAPDPHKP